MVHTVCRHILLLQYTFSGRPQIRLLSTKDCNIKLMLGWPVRSSSVQQRPNDSFVIVMIQTVRQHLRRHMCTLFAMQFLPSRYSSARDALPA